MGEYVRVESVDALNKFRAALCKFVEVVAVSLDEAEAELQRTSFWVKQEQQSYWKRQAETRAELCVRAKSALNRKKSMQTALGGRFSCIDEEKALAAAERQLEEAKQKQANVRRWSRLLDEETFSYEGLAQGMRVVLEADIPNALAQLDNMIVALEAYASSTAPAEQRSMAAVPGDEDLVRLGALPSMARDTPPVPRIAAEAYQRLRARTPPHAVRDSTPVSQCRFHWPEAADAGENLRVVLAGLNLAPTPIVADDKIVVARGAWDHARLYLERVESATADDSGWYVGYADDTEATGQDAVRVADLLSACPGLEAVLELPVGCLVVLDGVSLEAVLDPQGALLWSSDAPA